MATNKQRQLDHLYDWCSYCLDFVERQGSLPPPIVSAGRIGLEKAYKKGNLRAMRVAVTEMVSWTREWPEGIRCSLDRDLFRNFGHGLVGAAADREARIALVLQRGKIETADEYRLVRGLLDDGELDDHDRADAVDRILEAFEATV